MEIREIEIVTDSVLEGLEQFLVNQGFKQDKTLSGRRNEEIFYCREKLGISLVSPREFLSEDYHSFLGEEPEHVRNPRSVVNYFDSSEIPQGNYNQAKKDFRELKRLLDSRGIKTHLYEKITVYEKPVDAGKERTYKVESMKTIRP